MKRAAMIAGNPWTLLVTLEEDPDSLGCVVRFQELTMDGDSVDAWERFCPRLDEALRDVEMAYGIGPDDWIDLA